MEANMRRLKLLSDQPLGEHSIHEKERVDGLDFKPYVETLSQAIIDTYGPFTIGIFGDWGTGKTSLMRLIYERIDFAMDEGIIKKDKQIIPIWFNAWRFEKEEHLVVPLAITIIHALREHERILQQLRDGGKSLINALGSIAYGFSTKGTLKVPGFAEIETSLNAKDVIDRSEVLSSDNFLNESLYYNTFERIQGVTNNPNLKIVIFVDDLDRCFPDSAIKLLESIKLVLNQHNFVFILGVSRQVIEGYLEHRYQKEYGISHFKGDSYLDKIVQLPFYMPIHKDRIKYYINTLILQIDGLTKEEQKEFREILPFIASASGSNPRAIVRFINNLLVDKDINDNIFPSGRISISYYALSRGLQQRWSELFYSFSSDNSLCEEIAKWDRDKLLSMATKEGGLQKIAQSMLIDKNLQDLLLSKVGKSWLSNPDIRLGTTQFIQTNRIKPEETVLNKNFDMYISFLPKDVKSVVKIADFLTQKNIRVFLAKQERNIDKKQEELVELNITASKKFSLVIGKGFRLSQKHEKELGMMLDMKKLAGPNSALVIPILIGKATPEDIPWILRDVQYLDLRGKNFNEANLNTLISATKFQYEDKKV